MEMLSKINKGLKTNSLACLTGLLLTAISLSVSAGTITGSAHDFSSGNVWSGGEICVACHTPHNADTTVTDAPLWNHTVTTANYTLYTNPGTLDATTSQPTGVSKLCLSCHDGTVAIDSIVNSPLTSPPPVGTFIGSNGDLGTDLNNDHPISFAYTAALATLDGALHDPTSTTTTIGSGNDSKTDFISEVMLFGANNDQVECATCHDVHNKFTDGGKLLRISNSGSGLCLTCHNK